MVQTYGAQLHLEQTEVVVSIITVEQVEQVPRTSGGTATVASGYFTFQSLTLLDGVDTISVNLTTQGGQGNSRNGETGGSVTTNNTSNAYSGGSWWCRWIGGQEEHRASVLMAELIS